MADKKADYDHTGPARRATIKDVARLAGVSVGTVSHVLNGSKRTSSASASAVEAAVTALGFRPNGLARSLIARRTGRSALPGRLGPRLVTVGYLSIDTMILVDRVPEAGARMTSHGIHKMPGGPAANVAAFSAALGEPFSVAVELVSHVGDDPDSDWALERLAALGVNVDGTVRQRGGRLSRCIVLVDGQGERTILNEPLQVPVELVSRHLSDGRTGAGAGACVHFDGFHLETAFTGHDSLRSAGYRMSFHSAGLSADIATPSRLPDLLATFDLMLLDRAAFAGVTGGDPDLFVRPGRLFDACPDAICQAVVLTRGAAGAVLLRPGQPPFEVAAQPVPIVDATGAGDALAGIFLASWLAQGDPAVALTHAVRGASLSLTALGAQGRLARAVDVDPALAMAVPA